MTLLGHSRPAAFGLLSSARKSDYLTTWTRSHFDYHCDLNVSMQSYHDTNPFHL